MNLGLGGKKGLLQNSRCLTFPYFEILMGACYLLVLDLILLNLCIPNQRSDDPNSILMHTLVELGLRRMTTQMLL